MRDGAAFGQELRRARERRGMTLEEIAARTKVSAGLFAGLERGDVSKWPSGIFRRSFVRCYAETIGIDADEAVASFIAVYPEQDPQLAAADRDAIAPQSSGAAPLRLVLDGPPPRAGGFRADALGRRAAAAALDVAVAALPASLIGFVFGWQWFWIALACLGVSGHLFTLALAGTTPGSWLLLKPQAVVRVEERPAEEARRRLETETPVLGPRRHPTRHTAAARPTTTRARRIN